MLTSACEPISQQFPIRASATTQPCDFPDVDLLRSFAGDDNWYMAFEVKLEKPFAGFVADSARPGEQMLIQTSGFRTSSEGEPFIRILEGLTQHVLPTGSIQPSGVHHFLIVAGPDGKLTIYVNELEIRLKIQSQHSRQAGEPVWLTDIADIIEVNIGVDIPTDHGICLLFSVGWRKGLYFDFVPLSPERQARAYPIGPVLGAAWSALMFQERFSLTEDQWQWLIDQKMFLFIGLTPQLLQQIVTHAEKKWALGRLNDQVTACAKAIAPEVEDLAKGSPLFQPAAAALKIGLRHFVDGDAFSGASVLYPAVEGILRRHYASRNSVDYPKQARLIEVAKRAGQTGRHSYCLLLIERFDAYLREVIFADFDWKNPAGVSRHTIGHGVIEPDQCDAVSIARVVLTIQHLLLSLSPPPDAAHSA